MISNLICIFLSLPLEPTNQEIIDPRLFLIQYTPSMKRPMNCLLLILDYY